jgi:hypothetical protein
MDATHGLAVILRDAAKTPLLAMSPRYIHRLVRGDDSYRRSTAIMLLAKVKRSAITETK